MALKSIYDIEIDPSGKFAAFVKKFDAFQKDLAKAPTSWTKISGAMEKSAEELASMASARKLLNDMERKSGIELTKHQQMASYTSRAWQATARSTRDVAGNIAKATTSLLKWTALTGVFTGLIGAGGLFGIDRLAASVAGGRRSAQGLGLSYGQQQSFGVNYGRLVDAGGFLGNVNQALHDVSKRYALYGAGLSERDLAGANTGQVGAKLIENLGKIADQTPSSQMAQVLKARGLDQFISLQEFERLKAAGPAERAEIGRNYGRDVDPLSLANRTQKAWQDLDVQLSRAGKKIENVFVTGLGPLAPEISRLSDAVAEALKAFLSSPNLKQWIADFGEGIKTVGEYIGSDQFKTDVKDLAAGIGALGKATATALRWLGVTPTSAAQAAAEGGHSGWNANVDAAIEHRARRKTGGILEIDWGGKIANQEAYIREAARKRGIDPDTAVAVAKSEGLFNYKSTIPGETSYGPFQLHYGGDVWGPKPGLGDEFTKQTGLDARDPKTTQAQIEWTADYVSKHGWGDWRGWKGDRWAGINRDATSYVGSGKKPASTSVFDTGTSSMDNLVNKFSRVLDNARPGTQGVNVTITAAPGGNPIPITQQAAAQ